MYTKFRDLLRSAEGRNEWVAAINADIRGFTAVMSGDPAQTALYLRAVYGEILDHYFQERSFFKPTGDGLLLIVPFSPTDAELADVTRAVVADALRLNSDFAKIIASEKLIRFQHPEEIGIGISVGSVSRLVAGKQTLDYTGRPLNVASRLMDLARPNGVVFDSTLDVSALDEATQKILRRDHVYLKGVADEDGVDILYTAQTTRIPERYRKPLRPVKRFEEEPDRFTRAGAGRRGKNWYCELSHEPADRGALEVLVTYTPYRGGKPVSDQQRWFQPEFEYVMHWGQPHVVVDFKAIEAKFISYRIPARGTGRLDIAYTVDSETLAAAQG